MNLPVWLIELGKITFIVIILSNVLLFGWLLLARLYRRWRFQKLKKGLISYLHLSDWYASLSPKERVLFKKYYDNVANVPTKVDRLTEADIYSASETSTQLLVMVAASSMMNGNYQFAERLLMKAGTEAQSPWEKQQVLLAFSYLYFKQRDQLTGARENSINYSEKAIKSIMRFGTSDAAPPTLPFDQLITLCVEDEKYQKAEATLGQAIDLFKIHHPEIAERYMRQKEELKTRLNS
jgi:hypothetical protein